MDDLRIGIVGCGGISHHHARAARETPGAQIVACCDVNGERARAWGEQYQARPYTDFETLVREQQPDALILATWPVQHLEQVQQALALGVRNILCEKALAPDAETALAIHSAVNAADALLMEAVMYRHHPGTLRLRQLIDWGEIGAVDSVRGCFCLFDDEAKAPDDPTLAWNNRPECCNGVPHEIGVYPINGCNYFAGALPTRVFCAGGKALRYDVFHRFYGMIEYQNGVVGIIQSSKKAAHNRTLEISGGQGTLRTDIGWKAWEDGVVTRTQNKPWGNLKVDRHEIQPADAYQLQLANFVATIHGQAEPLMRLDESVRNIITLSALLESMETQRSVEVEFPEELKS